MPMLAMNCSSVRHSFATAAMISSTSTSTDSNRIGCSMRRAKPGAHARISMANATGIRMITATSMIFCTDGGTYWPLPRKKSSDRLRASGSVTRQSTLLIAVRVMLRATSLRARWL